MGGGLRTRTRKDSINRLDWRSSTKVWSNSEMATKKRIEFIDSWKHWNHFSRWVRWPPTSIKVNGIRLIGTDVSEISSVRRRAHRISVLTEELQYWGLYSGTYSTREIIHFSDPFHFVHKISNGLAQLELSSHRECSLNGRVFPQTDQSGIVIVKRGRIQLCSIPPLNLVTFCVVLLHDRKRGMLSLGLVWWWVTSCSRVSSNVFTASTSTFIFRTMLE